jgi:hypothetical protein
MTDKILTRREGAVAHIVFNNPDKLNAISLEMWQGMGDAVERFEADPEVRVIVLSGAAAKPSSPAPTCRSTRKSAWARTVPSTTPAPASAGSRRSTTRARRHRGDRWFLHRRRHLGGRLLRPAHRHAKSQFGQPAMRYGIGYRYKSLRRVTDLIGAGGAKDLLIGGAMFDAQRR